VIARPAVTLRALEGHMWRWAENESVLPVHQIGPDTYIITAAHVLVVSTQADGQALNKASKHCASMGQQRRTIDLHSTEPVPGKPGTATLEYRCVPISAR
jgi:hypothetical protein